MLVSAQQGWPPNERRIFKPNPFAALLYSWWTRILRAEALVENVEDAPRFAPASVAMSAPAQMVVMPWTVTIGLAARFLPRPPEFLACAS